MKIWLPSIVILITGVTWGVKLDDRSLQNKADIAIIEGKLIINESRVNTLSEQNTELNVLVRGMNQKLDYMLDKMDAHLEEAGQWKRKIIENETEIRNLQRRTP